MAELPIEEGQLIAAKYRVERILGSGAMGVVVAAWHLELAQRVAVKFVRPDAMSIRDAEERFRREARAAARIRSEHAVRVVDVGSLESGTVFMVMEYLDGHDLAQELLMRGPLPAYEAVSYLQQTIEALAEAHHAGIVHRDLKPANLFLARRPDGTRVVKVLDFGVSKAERNPGDLSLTQTSAIIGSPLYMSPEQLRSARDVDHRSDIWSLGVILFELLAGRAPYLGDSIAGLVTAMMDAPPSPRMFRPELSESLERVVLRCLERDPNARFSDVAALGAALIEFAPESRLHAERARRVLGVADPISSSVDTGAKTMNSSDASLRTPSLREPTQPTLAAWGQHQPSALKKPRRTALVVGAAALGVLVALLVLFRNTLLGGSGTHAAGSEPGTALGAAQPSASELSAPANPGVQQVPAVVGKVNEPPAVAPVAAPTEPVAPTPTVVTPVVPANNPPVVAPARPMRPAAPARPATAKPASNANQLPDFGGRR